jgi:molecular chaperone DnaJ
MEKRDYYEVLGLTKGASKQEIKSAYRKLAKEFHPDRNKAADAEHKFKEVQESYEVLSDERKKAAYDQYGHAGAQGFGGSGFDGAGGGGFSGFDMGDMGSINDIFEQFFGGGFGGFSSGGAAKPQKSRGEDLEFNLKISFEEGVFGADKTIRYKRRVNCNDCKGTGAKNGTSMKTCTQCNGSGQVRRVQSTFLGNFQTVTPCPSCHGSGSIIKEPCTVCNGNGIVNITDDFKIKVPQGIPNDVTLRFKEKGNAGKKGGSYGDLYINIEVLEHETLEKQGDDIYSDLTIDVSEAVLGAEKAILTVHGNDILKVPAGTQPETIIKLSGKGAPRFKGTGNGDHYIKVIVKVPQKLSKEQKELWTQIEASKNQKTGFSGIFH